MYVLKNLEKVVLEFQEMALQELVQQLIVALRRYYRFEEILGAITAYTATRQDWQKVTEHLLAARLEVLEVSARLRGLEEEEDDDAEIG